MINELFSSMHEHLDYMIQHYKDADSQQREQFCDCVSQLMETSDKIMDHYVAFEEKLAYFFDLYREIKQSEQSTNQRMSSTTVQLPTEEKNKSNAVLEQKGVYRHQAKQNDEAESKIKIPLSEKIIQATSISYCDDSHVTICNECDLFIAEKHEMTLDQAQGYYKLFMFEKAAHLLHSIITEEPECNIARLYYGMSLMHLRNWSEAQRQFQLLTVLSDFPKWLSLSYNALGCIQAIKLNMNQAEILFKKAYHLYPQFEDPLKNLESCSQSPKQLSLYFGSTELCCM